MPWGNPIVGSTILRRPAIQSPNFVSGSTGWALFQDGTAQLNELTIIVQDLGVALLIYQGAAGLGNLIGSWASQAGTDSFGNAYPAGLFAQGGKLVGGNISVATLVSCILTDPTITGANIGTSNIAGGTMTETQITFDNTGGVLLVYSQVTTTTSKTTAGDYAITIPAGVTSAQVQCWGADAGAGGGSTGEGGEGGGGGEYAAETSYPVTGGATYNYTVGAGGLGGVTGFGGTSGGDSFFDNGGVIAQGGQAGSGFIGGSGGNYGVNSIHHKGGDGGGDGTQSSGGCGGGGRAGSTGAGGNGSKSTGTSGAAGGTAGTGTGGHAGGNGGNSGANGNSGGGGGGAGKGTSSTAITETFYPLHTKSYYSDTGLRNTDGTMYHGAYSGEGPAFQYAYIQWDTGDHGNSVHTALNQTVNWVTLRLYCLHCWYNSGMTWGLHDSATLGGGEGVYSVLLGSFSAKGEDVNPGSGHQTYTLGSTMYANLKSGASTYTVLAPNAANETNLSWYGYFWGGGGNTANMPRLQINHQTSSSGSFTAGAGQDGRVDITYSSSTTLIAAIAPAAGTGPNGNNYPLGISGIVPGTDWVSLQGAGSGNAQIGWGPDGSAADVILFRNKSGAISVGSGQQLNLPSGGGPFIDGESFHAVTLITSGLTGILTGTVVMRVKLLPWNAVWFEVEASVTNTTTTFNLNGLPSASYYPVVARHFPIVVTSAATCRLFIPTSGGLQLILSTASSGTTIGGSGMYATN